MSRLIVLVSLVSILVAAAPARAQQPYAGLEERPIKALSEQQTPTCGRAAAWVWTPWTYPINSARRFRTYSPQEGRRRSARRDAARARGRPGQTVCREDHHADQPRHVHACDRRHAGSAPRRASQIPSPHPRRADFGTRPALRRTARLPSRDSARARTTLGRVLINRDRWHSMDRLTFRDGSHWLMTLSPTNRCGDGC